MVPTVSPAAYIPLGDSQLLADQFGKIAGGFVLSINATNGARDVPPTFHAAFYVALDFGGLIHLMTKCGTRQVTVRG